jgi:EpsI family protein
MKLKIIMVLTIAAFAAAGALVLKVGRPQAAVQKELHIPLQVNGWEGRDMGLSDDTIGVIRPDAYLFRNYERNGRRVNLYIGYYGSLKRSDSAHIPSLCYPAQGWTIMEESVTGAKVNGKMQGFSRLHVTKEGMDELVLSTFRNRDMSTGDMFRLRTNLVGRLLTGKPTDNAFIRFSMPVAGESKAAAETELKQFIADVHPYIDRLFQ